MMAALLATSMPSSRQAWWWHQLLQVPLAWLQRASAVHRRPQQTHDPYTSAHHSTFMTSLSGPQITGTALKLFEANSAFTRGLISEGKEREMLMFMQAHKQTHEHFSCDDHIEGKLSNSSMTSNIRRNLVV